MKEGNILGESSNMGASIWGTSGVLLPKWGSTHTANTVASSL